MFASVVRVDCPLAGKLNEAVALQATLGFLECLLLQVVRGVGIMDATVGSDGMVQSLLFLLGSLLVVRIFMDDTTTGEA